MHLDGQDWICAMSNKSTYRKKKKLLTKVHYEQKQQRRKLKSSFFSKYPSLGNLRTPWFYQDEFTWSVLL